MKHLRGDARRMRVVALVLAATALAGCLGGFSPDLLVSASAPITSDGITVFASTPDGDASGQASYRIEREGRIVYPPGGLGGVVPMANGHGSVFVPYERFVEGNGPYTLVVTFDGDEARTVFQVEKWVEFVYLHPYYKGGRAWIDLQLSKAMGGSPDDRVVSRGDLIIQVDYRGLDGRVRQSSGVIRQVTPDDATFTRIEIPRSVIDDGPGYYSFEATFHNDEAKGNTGVKNDPSLAQRSPPWNWLYVGPR